MTKEEAQKRIDVLRKEIDENRYLYHVLDRPRVSDAVDDSLKRELANLEEQFLELITADSPTQRVAGKPLDKFTKVTHASPMLSLNDAFSEEDLQKWEQRLKKLVGDKNIGDSGYYCELKMDGLAVSLTYKDGVFSLGSTRGDGRVGEDVTNNLKTVESIPLRIKNSNLKIQISKFDVSSEIEIRGEIYLSKSEFKKLNDEQKKRGLPLYANPRNIAAGSIRQLDPKVAASRNLKFMMYATVTNIEFKNHSDEHEFAKSLGFATNRNNKICKNLNEVFEYLKHWSRNREKLPYQTDGIVVGVNDKKLFTRLGVVGKAPRGQIAFKFPAEEATSVVRDIVVQVGRTGKLTPVAQLDSTLVAGSTVSRATLHNEDEIRRKDIKIGDTVIIRKAGDVIPEVVEPIIRMRTGAEKIFSMPKICPICGSAVVKREGEVDYYCSSKNCLVRERRQLEHFVSKGAFEIDGLGPKILEKLIEEGLIKDAADIFALKIDDLEPLERFAEKSAQNLIDSINQSRKIDLERFIYSLGIRHIGSQMAADVARQFGSFDKLLKTEKGDFDRMYGIGDKVADSLIEFLQDEKNKKLIERMQKLGVKIRDYHSPVSANKLDGKSFIVTGSLQTMTREEAHKKIIQYGGWVASSVSAQTDYLIAGDDPGSKLAKAQKLKVKIISEQEFLKMISS